MTTIAIHNQNSQSSSLLWTPKLGRLLGVIAGSAFSPVFPLLKWALLPTLDVDHLLTGNLHPVGLLNMAHQLQALGGKILLLQIFPILAIGTLLAFVWLALCGHFGMRCTRYLHSRLNIHPNTSLS